MGLYTLPIDLNILVSKFLRAKFYYYLNNKLVLGSNSGHNINLSFLIFCVQMHSLDISLLMTHQISNVRAGVSL
jgi:hypothetical protein